MTQQQALEEIAREAAELVKRAADPRRKTITVSPEVAALLEAVRPAAAAAAAISPADTDTAETPPPADLDGLRREVRQCVRCPLHQTRTQTVFGGGAPHAGLVFVGEAPGFEEDRQGEPFVGRAGKLLTDIVVKGMKMRREDVYLCNVLKCRPPNNRDPNPEEMRQCEPYLIAQLELIQPKVICALGRHAAQTLLRSTESTGRLRGKWHNYRGIPFRVTYHPAYLLRSPGEKRKTWEDVQEVMKVLRGEVTPDLPPRNDALLDV